MLRSLFLISLTPLFGCVNDGDPLTSLTEAWGGQTVAAAGPPITAALVVGGLAAELCNGHETVDWTELDFDDPPPLSDMLFGALGEPSLVDVQIYDDNSLQVTLSGLQLMDREAASMRFIVTPGTQVFGFEAVVLDGKETDPEINLAESFGQIAIDVQSDCVAGVNRLEGTAIWTDLNERSHSIQLPADVDLSSGLGFLTDVPYLPNAGTISWTGRVDGQERTVTTNDAADIVLTDSDSDVPMAQWPAVVRGVDWQSEVQVEIAP